MIDAVGRNIYVEPVANARPDPELVEALGRLLEPPRLGISLFIGAFLSPVTSVMTWAWNIVCLKAKKDGLALTLLFCSALNIAPFYISVAMAVSGIVLIAFSITNTKSRLDILVVQNEMLTNAKRNLEAGRNELVEERNEAQLRYRHVTREKNDLTIETGRLMGEIGELTLAQAPLLIEQRRLRNVVENLQREKQEALSTNEQLIQERNQARGKERQKSRELVEALGKLEVFQHKQGMASVDQKLTQVLEQFQKLYHEEEGKGEIGKEALVKIALDRLIPRFKKHREQINSQLRIAIAQLPAEGVHRAPLLGILKLTERESRLLERISQALLLIKEQGQR